MLETHSSEMQFGRHITRNLRGDTALGDTLMCNSRKLTLTKRVTAHAAPPTLTTYAVAALAGALRR